MKTIHRKCLSVFLLSLSTLLNVCLAQELPASVSSELRRAGIPLNAVGVVVQEVGSGNPLVAVNPLVAFSPASTMKLLTTDAALELLGPAFTWKTHVYMNGSVRGDVLQGDLIFKGGGDPKLVVEKFWLLLRQIRATGIREIRGNVLIDRSAFELSEYDPAKFDGDPIKPYNAPPDAMLLNFEMLRFQFSPAAIGATSRVTVDPPLAGYAVAPPQTSSGDCGDWQGRLGASFGVDYASFAGSYATDCGEKAWYVYPFQMSRNQYFSAVFKQMWADAGGKFEGEVLDGVAPPDAQLVTVWESAPLPEVIRDINKFSNNVMARQLLLTLASAGENTSLSASPERGALAIKTWLDEKRINAPELQIENGSGLSRNERIAPESMAQLLLAAYRSALMPEFISSLPLAGLDGTMRHRVADQSVAGNAHIKTGTLNEVKAAAGYVLAVSGKRYVVVFFVNHANAAHGEAAQDALLEWIHVHG